MLAFYFDEDAMSRNVIQSLRLRGLDVSSVSEAGLLYRPDETQLAFAAQQGRVLVSFNVADFCRLHGDWLAQGKSHAGILLAHQRRRYSVVTQLRGLLQFSAKCRPEELRDRLEFLRDWI
jgi:hypothetical protein